MSPNVLVSATSVQSILAQTVPAPGVVPSRHNSALASLPTLVVVLHSSTVAITPRAVRLLRPPVVSHPGGLVASCAASTVYIALFLPNQQCLDGHTTACSPSS